MTPGEGDIPDGVYCLLGPGAEDLRGRTVRFVRNLPTEVWSGDGRWVPLTRGQIALVRARAEQSGALVATSEPVPRVRKASDELHEVRAMEASVRRVCRDRRMLGDRGDVVLVADIEAVLPL